MYYFFFSYARDDFDECFGKFYKDLVTEISQQTGDPVDQIGFRDSPNIEVGDHWPKSIAQALKTSKVFIYLNSPTYFNHELCGREWEAFRLRIRDFNKKNNLDLDDMHGLMIPAYWRPLPKNKAPACVEPIQYTNEGLGMNYSEHGLFYIMKRQPDLRRDYEDVLQKFSQIIIKAAEYNLPEADSIPDIRQVKNAFEAGPAAQSGETETSAEVNTDSLGPTGGLSTGLKGPREAADWEKYRVKIFKTVMQKFIIGQFTADKLPTDKDYVDYTKLFSYITKPNWTVESPNIFEEISKKINQRNSTNNLLLVNGLAGSGKSTFLSLLYLYLYTHIDDCDYIPILLNLHYYDTVPYDDDKSFSEQAEEQWRMDLAPLFEVAELYPAGKIIIIIDGVDEYFRTCFNQDSQIEKAIKKLKIEKKVLGLSLTGEYTKHKKALLPFSSFFDPDLIIDFQSLASNDKRTADFIIQFCKIANPGDYDASTRYLKEKISSYKIKNIDLFSLSLLHSKKGSWAYQDVRTLGGFYEKYCIDYLGGGDLAEVSKLAFRYAMQQDKIPKQEIEKNRGWKLIHQHRTFKDFLLATYSIKELSKIGELPEADLNNLKEADLEAFDFVYPQEVDRFIKELLNKDANVQEYIYKTITKIYPKSPLKARAHFCYLLGRFSSPATLHSAMGKLLEYKNDLDNSLQIKDRKTLENVDSKLLLLLRSICISLIYFGTPRVSDEYLGELMKSRRLDNLNRGFHLEYYGDIPYQPHESLSHEDNLEIPFYKTYSTLYNKLNEAISSGKKYNLFDVDIYTLCSLIQHRQIEGCQIDIDKMNAVKKLVDRVLHNNPVNTSNDYLYTYLFMISKNFEKKDLTLGTFINDLFKIKETKRSGWVDRGIENGESVADHIYGAFLIGLLYLPDAIEGDDAKNYNKELILKTILIHDLAEAYVGDKVKKTDEDKKEENRWLDYICMLGTNKGIANLFEYRELYHDFASADTINARIAKEIDKIDNFLQLHIYSSRGYKISDFEQWENGIREQIRTPTGTKIFNIIESYFKKKPV